MAKLSLLLLLAIWSQGLQALWWSNPELDGGVIYACQGSMVSLPWQYNLTSGDVVTSIQWLYTDRSEEVIAVLTHDTFGAFPYAVGQVFPLGSAGINFGPVTTADSGNYSVEVDGSDANGQHFKQRHSVYVQISDRLMTQDGYVNVPQNPVPVLDTNTGKWAVELLCGVFTFLRDPPYFMQWITPSGAVQNSSSYDNGYYHLLLTDAFETGRYTCQVPRQDQNQSCVSGQGSADAEASIVVDGVQVSLTLLDKEYQQLSQQLQQLPVENQQQDQTLQQLAGENQQLSQQLQQLSVENQQQNQTLQQLAGENQKLRQQLKGMEDDMRDIGPIRLVGGQNESEGRVEIRVGNKWGTICDDNWDNNDAQVVCNMLGYFKAGAKAKNSAYFGQGTGPIVLDEVNCVGTENGIRLCAAKPFGSHNCVHSEDAGVECVDE